MKKETIKKTIILLQQFIEMIHEEASQNNHASDTKDIEIIINELEKEI